MSKKRKVHKNKYAHLVPKRDKSHLEPFTPQATLDYHDRGPLSKYEIEKLLEDFLLESYTDGLNKVLIITGKGQVVRPIVSKSLKKNSLVQKSSKAGYYNGQSGAFEVYLKKD
jgi:DNA-nicking Smr family endonuclease